MVGGVDCLRIVRCGIVLWRWCWCWCEGLLIGVMVFSSFGVELTGKRGGEGGTGVDEGSEVRGDGGASWV
jgi:hypothetical protein